MSEDFPALSGFRAGMLVAGYRLEAPVGAGGMAMVFRARDQRLNRPVALKILAPQLAADQEFRRRFIAESRAAAAVDDPHIIPIYEAGEAGGALFIAMRFVAGGDLRQVLSREGPLTPARSAELVSPVASALDAAHRAGLVHRDVKPANILVDAREGRPDHVYLSDFGVSKGAMSSVRLTGTGQYLGTPEYSAPEQASGGAVDGRTDQYALACVAWELLTGSVPFERDQGMAVLLAQVTEPPPSLGGRRPGLPAPADQVMARALAKTPAQRYPTCQDFSEALREALGLPPYTSPAAPAVPDPAAAQVREAAGPIQPRDELTPEPHALTVTAGPGTPPGITGEPATPAHARSRPGSGGHRTRPSRRLRRVHLTVIALAAGAVLAAAIVIPVQLTTTTRRPPAPPNRPSAPAAASGARLYDNIRYSNGTWQRSEPPAPPPGTITGVIANAYTQADVHVDVVTSSGLWDNIRHGSGTWQGWQRPPQPPGTVLKLAEAPDTSADLWMVASTTSGLYFSERAGSTGTWSKWAAIPAPGNGDIADMSASVSADNGLDQLQVAVLLRGGQLWHNLYNINTGTWQAQGWAQPTQVPGGGVSVAVAGMANGDAQFMVISANGTAYHNIRYPDSWQGWAPPTQPPVLRQYPATVSASADSQGNAQFIITEHTNGRWIAYHDIRYANGTWQGWDQLDTDGPRCAPVITLPTFTASATIGVAHVDEVCGRALAD